MSSIELQKLTAAIEKHVGINDQLYVLKQHSKAITDPKQYYEDYKTAVEKLKDEMAALTDNLLKEGKKQQKEYGYTDDYVHQVVGEQVSSMYNTRLNQLRSAFPDIDSAAKQININHPSTVGISVKRTTRRAPVRRAPVRRTTAAKRAAPKKKTTKRKTRK